MNHNQHKRLAIASLCAIVAMSSSAQAQSPAHPHQGAATASPYAGEQSRDIKALSATETNNLLNGAGMGYAKAAELNGYPGPMHVLELARPLKLTDAQRIATEKLLTEHKRETREIGAQVVALERQLDAAFANKSVSERRIGELTTEIAVLLAKLRAAHLQTHLQQTALLQVDQVAAYQKLRGYETSSGSTH